MKKWKKNSSTRLMIALIAVSLAITASASAWGKPPDAGSRPFEDLFEMLDNNQKEEVKAILEKYRGQFKSADSDNERIDIRNSMKDEINAVLTTDEQKQELDEVMNQMKKNGPPSGNKRYGRP